MALSSRRPGPFLSHPFAAPPAFPMKSSPVLLAAALACAVLESGCATSAESPAPSRPAETSVSRADAVEAGELTQRPRPIRRVPPRFPTNLRRAGQSGVAVVDFIVGSDGGVYDTHAVRATHPEFAEAAVACVSQWRFEPGRIDGRAVNCRMQVPIEFRLNER